MNRRKTIIIISVEVLIIFSLMLLLYSEYIAELAGNIHYPYREYLEKLKTTPASIINAKRLHFKEWEILYRDCLNLDPEEFLLRASEWHVGDIYYNEILCPTANMVEFYFRYNGTSYRTWTEKRIPPYPGSCTTREFDSRPVILVIGLGLAVLINEVLALAVLINEPKAID